MLSNLYINKFLQVLVYLITIIMFITGVHSFPEVLKKLNIISNQVSKNNQLIEQSYYYYMPFALKFVLFFSAIFILSILLLVLSNKITSLLVEESVFVSSIFFVLVGVIFEMCYITFFELFFGMISCPLKSIFYAGHPYFMFIELLEFLFILLYFSGTTIFIMRICSNYILNIKDSHIDISFRFKQLSKANILMYLTGSILFISPLLIPWAKFRFVFYGVLILLISESIRLKKLLHNSKNIA